MAGDAADLQAIRDIVDRQFASMNWSAGSSPDIATFRGDFLPGAMLYPAARPASGKSLDEFSLRMSELAQKTLTSFHETMLGGKILIFGNVAVAAVACENTENGADVNRNVEMLLLVKTDGQWKIVAQAWDRESESLQIPDELLTQSPI